jgi:hypothetical protein
MEEKGGTEQIDYELPLTPYPLPALSLRGEGEEGSTFTGCVGGRGRHEFREWRESVLSRRAHLSDRESHLFAASKSIGPTKNALPTK